MPLGYSVRAWSSFLIETDKKLHTAFDMDRSFLHLVLWSQYLKIREQRNREKTSCSFHPQHLGLSDDRVFTQTVKAEAWTFGKKRAKKSLMASVTPLRAADLCGWAEFQINGRAAAPFGTHYRCCLTFDSIVSSKAKCGVRVSYRQTGSICHLCPQSNLIRVC